MKHLFLTILALCVIQNSSLAEKETIVKSTIKEVTVYTQGAQIERKASYSVSKGITTIVIEGISPQIDPNSLQVQATGSIVILDSKYSIFYPEPEPIENPVNGIPQKVLLEIDVLNDSIFDINYEISGLQYRIDVLLSEKRIIENNGTIKGQGKVNDSIPLLMDAIEYYHKKMNDINLQLLQLDRKKALVTKELTTKNKRLTDLQNYNSNNNFVKNPPKEPIHQLKVTISAKESAVGRLKLSYLVNQAGWIPLYDLRSSAAANKIDLTYKANVYQNTGIDWSGVKLKLSTNNPYANKTKPTLYPWYLDYYTYQNNSYNESQQGVNRSLSPGSSPDLKKVEKNREIMELAEDDFDALTAENFTQMTEQLISVEYSIDLPYSITSDNKKNMVLVSTKTLYTEYMYYAVPKFDLSVYMVARITNLGALNLIPGKANLFHEGAYLGDTYINPNTMKDTLDLSLGKDPSIIVKRTLLKNDSKEKIVGDKIIKTLAYRIEIKNHKTKTIKLITQDQVPVSRNKEIEVELNEISRANFDEVTGILEWQSKMRSSDSKVYSLKYTVKYDKTQNINLASY